MTDIKTAFISLIEKTGHPRAPFILQEAYASLEQLGPMLAQTSTLDKVLEYEEILLKDIPDIEGTSSKPEFIMALAAILANSLVDYASKMGQR